MKSILGVLFLFAFVVTVNAQLVEIKPTDNWENYIESTKYFNANFNEVGSSDAKYFCREMRETQYLYGGVRLIYRLDSTLYAIESYLSLDKNQLDGTVQYYNEKEILISIKKYVHGSPRGAFKYFFDNGTLRSEGKYFGDDFKLVDTLRTYYPSGNLRRLEYYDRETFKRIEGKCFAHDGSDTTYFEYRIEAQFNGGPEALQRWISLNVVYPAEAMKYLEKGKVEVTFVVEEDGSITNVYVSKGVSVELDKEAIRVVKKMPKWIPGSEDGFLQRTRCKIPFVFSL